MYKKKLLYTVAQNEEGGLVNAKDANKDQNFCCPVCNGEMILRRSETQKRRPHFAHKALTTDCTPESALHFAFKNQLCEKINRKIKEKTLWNMSWKCEYCNETHKVNLLGKTKNAKSETNLEECRPDITLFDEDDNAIIAIEIVVTHFPEEKSLDYLRKAKIVLIRFDIEKEEDLDIINSDILTPSSVLCCLKYSRCEKCGSFMKARTIGIALAQCWKCHTDMKIAYPDRDKNGIPNKEQWDFLEQHGVKIRERTVRGVEGKDHLNVCPKCNRVTGRSYHHHYFCGQYDIEEYIVGYDCPVCKNNVKLPQDKFHYIERDLMTACHAEHDRTDAYDEEDEEEFLLNSCST